MLLLRRKSKLGRDVAMRAKVEIVLLELVFIEFTAIVLVIGVGQPPRGEI